MNAYGMACGEHPRHHSVTSLYLLPAGLLYHSFDSKDDEEHLGRFVGISEHVGHALTFKILTKDLKIIS